MRSSALVTLLCNADLPDWIRRRTPFVQDGARSIQVSGFTAAAPENMSTWLGQFSLQDELALQTRAG